MSVRLRRLKADYDRISTAFSGNTRIRILRTVGQPPEKYQVEYLVTSMQKDAQTQKLKQHNSFIAEISLTGSYPRMAPQCKMITPVFHPNIAPHAICIGDHWAAGETLVNLIVRIGEMLSFQSYNIKSPLNGQAARWCEENQGLLPLDTFDFCRYLSVGEVVDKENMVKSGVVASCANCGKSSQVETLTSCINGHAACSDCVIHCSSCNRTLCLKCSINKCSITGGMLCHHCAYKCPSCARLVDSKHTVECSVCKSKVCSDCIVNCDKCGQPACISHVKKQVIEGNKQYLCLSCLS
ncbi:MAG: hypothetical protein JXR97_05965 [Planctomycetes bacterium]|nr:hypothetical protein [Planctomycetota bacterium]